MGEVVGAIVSALERNGYVERSFFGIKDGGVALVTRLERIGDDGSSVLEPQRWAGDFRHRLRQADSRREEHRRRRYRPLEAACRRSLPEALNCG